MAVARVSLVLASVLLRCVSGARVHSVDIDLAESAVGSDVRVQPAELADFFSAVGGLSMTKSEAETLAKKEANSLSRCSITVPQLQALREVLYSPTKGLDFQPSQIREKILPIAYQHPTPADLRELFVVLWSPKLMNVESSKAKDLAIELGKLHISPAHLEGLHNVVSKIAMSKDKAQEQTVDFAMAGADPDTLKSRYQALTSKLSRDEALGQAVKEAVAANLKGLEQRYARDSKPYDAKAFQAHFGGSWLKEWIAAPEQKRTAMDGKDYTAREFQSYYGDSWEKKWTHSPEATQHRISEDGKEYTLEEFASFYKGAWQSKWQAAKEVLSICAGLNKESCSSFGTCEWKWTGDWTTSCTPTPVTVNTACEGLNHHSCDEDNTCKWKWSGDWTTSCIPA